MDVFGKRLLNAYYDHSAEVDDLISSHLRNWTMARLPRVSLTVLRLALAEMLYGDEKEGRRRYQRGRGADQEIRSR